MFDTEVKALAKVVWVVTLKVLALSWTPTAIIVTKTADMILVNAGTISITFIFLYGQTYKPTKAKSSYSEFLELIK